MITWITAYMEKTFVSTLHSLVTLIYVRYYQKNPLTKNVTEAVSR